MSRIHGSRLLAWLVCSGGALLPAAVTLAQPGPMPARPIPPPTVAQVLSDGGWRSLTWYLLTREDREEVYLRDVGLDPGTAAALAEYGGRAVSAYAAHDAGLKARFCPRLAGITTGPELGAAMREWTPLGQQELTRLLAGAFEMLSDEDDRRVTRHLGKLSQTTVFLGDDVAVDYETLTPAHVARVVAGACSPDA